MVYNPKDISVKQQGHKPNNLSCILTSDKHICLLAQLDWPRHTQPPTLWTTEAHPEVQQLEHEANHSL